MVFDFVPEVQIPPSFLLFLLDLIFFKQAFSIKKKKGLESFIQLTQKIKKTKSEGKKGT